MISMQPAAMTPDTARAVVETQRSLIRDWDLQRRGKSLPHAEPVSDEQADRSASLIEEAAHYLSGLEREEAERLVAIVRTRLELKAGSQFGFT
jgi:hypothetical protein